MNCSGRGMNHGSFIRELLVAWIVTLSSLAIGLLLLALHEPSTDNRTVRRWYERPIADAEEWEEDLSAPRGADWMVPQSGSSAAPSLPAN
jgi:hypothetical protein